MIIYWSYIYIDRNMSTVVNPMVLISLMAFCGLIMVMNNGYSGGYLEACWQVYRWLMEETTTSNTMFWYTAWWSLAIFHGEIWYFPWIFWGWNPGEIPVTSLKIGNRPWFSMAKSDGSVVSSEVAGLCTVNWADGGETCRVVAQWQWPMGSMGFSIGFPMVFPWLLGSWYRRVTLW